MPEELDPLEIQYYEQLEAEARGHLQRFAPQGATLLLQYERDPSLSSSWQVTAHVESEQNGRVDVNSYLCNILAIANNSPSPDGHLMSWYGEEGEIGGQIARRVGEVVWNDPHAYGYRISRLNQPEDSSGIKDANEE